MLISVYNSSFAEEFKFETSKIELLDNGKLIKALKGKAISVDQNIEVEALKFEYNKDLDVLKVILYITELLGEITIQTGNI